MLRKTLFYGAALIGVYLFVANATTAGKLITDTTGGVSGVVKTFQGR